MSLFLKKKKNATIKKFNFYIYFFVFNFLVALKREALQFLCQFNRNDGNHTPSMNPLLKKKNLIE